MHAYNKISDALLGAAPGGGFLSQERRSLEKSARRTSNLEMSQFLFRVAATFDEARVLIAGRLYDIQRGIASIAHYYEIEEREGYYREDSDSHHPRVPLSLDTLVLHSNSATFAAKLNSYVLKARNDIVGSIRLLARSFEHATNPDYLGYVPALYARAAHYEGVCTPIEAHFGVLRAVIRNKSSSD